MKSLLIITGALLFGVATQAQTLFTYGNKEVSADEFIRAFRKNVEPGTVTEASVRNYLDLYTRFKLKVQDAYNMKLDTLVNKQEDIAAFQKQIEDQFMFDSLTQVKMTQEAMARGRKEIRISHIFIPFKDEFASYPQLDIVVTPADREKAKDRANKAFSRIRAGEDFGNIALEYSADSSVRLNRGDLGYITVFTLPYNLENVAYSLPVNGVSNPFPSEKGYHIFKQTGERPASGAMQVQQILIAYDAEAGEKARHAASVQADSIYQALLRGASFEALARSFSYDAATAASGGILPPVSVGMYEPAFEEKLFSLTKDAQLAAPFETALGFHIIKRIRHIQADTTLYKGDPWNVALTKDARGIIPQKIFAQKSQQITGMKVQIADLKELYRFTDSTLQGGKAFSSILNMQTVLLRFPERSFNTNDWLGFVQSRRKHGTQEEYDALWEEFRLSNSASYYREHMTQYNPLFRAQITEFMEGNMLFEVMERKVWSKAAADTTGLQQYYNSHRSAYQWNKSADVIIFSASDSLSAAKARKEVVQKPANWRQLMDASGGKLVADSSRMDWKLVQAENTPMKNNVATPIMVNREDQSATFAYILRTYAKPSPKSFNDARVQVVNDYQTVLEETWIENLRRQYPIVVNNTTFKQVLNTLQH